MGTHEPTLTARLLRWGGLAAIVGASLVVAGTVVGTVLYTGQGGLPEFAHETGYFVATGLGFLGAVPLVFGLISLYRPQSEQAGAWGVAGFVGAMLGTLLLAASLWTQAMVVPSVSAHAPGFLELVSSGEVTGPLGIAVVLPLAFEVIGYLLFGIATYRAGVFSRATGVVLIVSAAVQAVPHGITIVPLMLTLAWMGYRVFTGQVGIRLRDQQGREPAGPQPTPASATRR